MELTARDDITRAVRESDFSIATVPSEEKDTSVLKLLMFKNCKDGMNKQQLPRDITIKKDP